MRTYEGVLQAHPQMTDIVIYAYRKSIFEKHGLSPPTNEDELMSVLDTIKREETDKGTGLFAYADMWAPGYQAFTFGDWMYHYGGKFFEEGWEPVFNDDAALRGLERAIETLDYAPPNALEFNHEISNVAYLTGQVAIIHQWWTVSGSFMIPDENPYFDDTGFFARVLDTTCSGMMGFGIPTFDPPDKEEAAFRMLEWVYSKENAEKLMGLGAVPIRKSTFEDEKIKNEQVPIPEQWDAAKKTLESVWSRPKFKHSGVWDEIMNAWVLKAYAGDVGPQEALDNAVKETKEQLDTLGYYD
jgi:multiple sugar transport system substrate-binding protein